MGWRSRLLAAFAGLALVSLCAVPLARATVDMQKEAKKLGFPVESCLYCHASPHAVDTMKERAAELNIAKGNCMVCQGADIPAALNDRGKWLVAEKARRDADRARMAWLADYVEPDDVKDTKSGSGTAPPEKQA